MMVRASKYKKLLLLSHLPNTQDNFNRLALRGQNAKRGRGRTVSRTPLANAGRLPRFNPTPYINSQPFAEESFDPFYVDVPLYKNRSQKLPKGTELKKRGGRGRKKAVITIEKEVGSGLGGVVQQAFQGAKNSVRKALTSEGLAKWARRQLFKTAITGKPIPTGSKALKKFGKSLALKGARGGITGGIKAF